MSAHMSVHMSAHMSVHMSAHAYRWSDLRVLAAHYSYGLYSYGPTCESWRPIIVMAYIVMVRPASPGVADDCAPAAGAEGAAEGHNYIIMAAGAEGAAEGRNYIIMAAGAEGAAEGHNCIVMAAGAESADEAVAEGAAPTNVLEEGQRKAGGGRGAG